MTRAQTVVGTVVSPMSGSPTLNTEKKNKTPAQAFTPPADEKKMGTIWIFVYTPSTAQAGMDAGISWS